MDNNIRTRLPHRGDIFARIISSESGHKYDYRDNVYFKLETFDRTKLPSNTYEVLGVVAWRFHDEVMVVFRKNVSKKYCGRAWWTLSGYTLDGNEHTGVLKIRTSTNWDTAVSKTITYSASDLTEFVQALNTTFTTDSDFVGQDWYARIDGTTESPIVTVHCNNIDYRQCYYNTASDGFSFVGGALPDVPYHSTMKRKNGGAGAGGASGSFDRYVYYYESQPEATLTSQAPIKTTSTPVSKLTYINSEYCSNLREMYGKGRPGWIKYMKSCKPVRETDYGVHGIHNGKERGKLYGTKTYVSATQTTPKPMMDASEYCYNLPTYESLVTVNTGEFWLPTTQELDYIMQDIHYGTNSDRNSDPINAGLVKISGTAISNGSYWWSCVRYSSSYACFVYGNYGYFDRNYMYYGFQVVPVSIFTLKN